MGDILTYLQEIKKAMDLLSKDDKYIRTCDIEKIQGQSLSLIAQAHPLNKH